MQPGMTQPKDLPADLLSLKEWTRLTFAIGRPRSAALKSLDDALGVCDQMANSPDFLKRAAARWRLDGALRTWKESCGPGDAWKKSVRNKSLAVERLTAQLTGGDTAAAWGRMPGYMQPNVEHARLGVVYLLGHLEMRPDIFSVLLEGGLGCAGAVMSYQGGKVDDGGLGKAAVSTAQDVFNSVMVPGSVILNAGAQAVNESSPPAAGAMAKRLRDFFAALIRKTLDILKEKFGGIEPTAAAVKNLINICCKLFWSTLGYGLVSGGMDTFKGLVTFADALITRVRTYLSSRTVVLAEGHPNTVVQSIVTAMNLSVMKGLWLTLKGAGNIGLAFATWGTSMIVGLVTALVEMVVKVVWRLVELVKMQQICKQALEHWGTKDTDGALHKKPFAFNNWFRGSVAYLPALAVITLNSGICGDKMVWLSMFTSDDHHQGSEILPEQFKKGSEHLDALKPWGADYLDNCGFSFDSSDEFIKKLLVMGHGAQLSGAEKFWKRVVQVAQA